MYGKTTINELMTITGWSFQFLKQYIPYPLKPMHWEDWDDVKRRDYILRRILIFDELALKEFFRQICRENLRHSQVITELQMMTEEFGMMHRRVQRIENFLFHLDELMDLSELAKNLGLSPKTIYNKLQTWQEDGIKVGQLKLPGFEFKLRKLGNKWKLSRYEYLQQSSSLGFHKRMMYLGHWRNPLENRHAKDA